MEMQVANEEVLGQVIQGIKSFRKANKVTLESFYFDTGIHIARIEQGKQNITILTLIKISAYYKISLKDFFAGL